MIHTGACCMGDPSIEPRQVVPPVCISEDVVQRLTEGPACRGPSCGVLPTMPSWGSEEAFLEWLASVKTLTMSPMGPIALLCDEPTRISGEAPGNLETVLESEEEESLAADAADVAAEKVEAAQHEACHEATATPRTSAKPKFFKQPTRDERSECVFEPSSHPPLASTSRPLPYQWPQPVFP